MVAPLRSPLRARVERKQDLANIIGKLGRDCRRGRNQDVKVEGIDLGVARREELTIGVKVMSIRENPAHSKRVESDWLQSRAEVEAWPPTMPVAGRGCLPKAALYLGFGQRS